MPPRRTAATAAVLFVALALTSVIGCSAATATSARRVPAFATLKDAPPSTVQALDLDRFAGRWYVVVSNFVYWTEHDRSDPTFEYVPIPHPTVGKLADRVDYRQRGRAKKFVGVDLQDPTRAGHFHWQGDGWLYGVKNQWFVVALDDDYRWAVIYFSKSNFGTGAGLEIISRTPTLPPSDRIDALAAISADRFLASRAKGLFDPPHGDSPPSLAPAAPAAHAPGP